MFTPPPAHLSARQIQESFGRIHASKGEQATLAGRTELLAVKPLDTPDLEISGRVTSADKHHRVYEVQVFYQPDDDWVFSGDCTCPARNDCQHCAAVLYAWLRIKPAPVANPLVIKSWLKSLSGVESASVPKAVVPMLSQWIYVLYPAPQPHTLWVEVAYQERANPQKPWRNARVYLIEELWPERQRQQGVHVLSEDRELFQLLWALQQTERRQRGEAGVASRVFF